MAAAASPGSSHPAAAAAPSDVPAIQIVGLYKSFNGRAVLKNVNLTVPRGTTTVILGGSGSGKSVLMKHIISLLKPDRGDVLVDGENIVPLTGPSLDRVRRKFGMVFQSAALFDSMTVGDNVAFPLKEHTKLNATERAQKVAEKRMPAELSGGMRKRVGLARAIVLEPQIVLYDEPTTGLDPITTENVDQMILEAKAALGVTSVVISHDIGSAFLVADQIAFLYDGAIVEAGPPAELRKSREPHVQAFLRTWFEKGG